MGGVDARPTPPSVSLTFPPHPVWVRTARDAVRTLLLATPHADLADTAVLLTSEAVTNAINACADKGCTTPVTLHAGWWFDPHHRLRVLVHDAAPGLPTPRTPAQDDEEGRGLHLISSGADAWGVCAHGPGRGKATWFELGHQAQTHS
ncbi:ATP-binding protein [Streptomyces sp. NPDC088812]|uniref:ATP-binding protein n=1 Tax=Streptomyces sp. NPDC088812 TaxID=3365905 RepID=UPI00381618FC